VVVAAGMGDVLEFDAAGDLDGLARPGWWGSYVLGVVHFMRDISRHAGVRPANLRVCIDSDVPMGAGLSSSAALEVAVATLLERAWGFRIEEVEKARRCRDAEHRFAGVPCGVMDQYIATTGCAGSALLIDCDSERASLVPMPPADRAVVLVIDTRVRHALGASEYPRRRETSESAARALGVGALCRATAAQVAAARGRLTEEQRAAAEHAVSENARTLAMADALRSGDLASAGRLMLESHASLRDRYRVSCDELDAAVEALAGSPGVFGARMTGGGFGGCAVALVEPTGADGAAERARRALRERFGTECGAMITPAGEGCRGESVGDVAS
jgi:galactokinase